MKRTPANSCFWYWYVIQWFLACKNNYLVKMFSRDITKLHKRGKYADQILLSYVSENTYIYFWHAYIFLICIYFRHPYIFLICIYFWHAYNSEMHIFSKINKYKQYMKKDLIWILLQMSNYIRKKFAIWGLHFY